MLYIQFLHQNHLAWHLPMKRSERQLRRRTGLWEPLRIGKKRNHHAQQYLEGLQTQTLQVQHPATNKIKLFVRTDVYLMKIMVKLQVWPCNLYLMPKMLHQSFVIINTPKVAAKSFIVLIPRRQRRTGWCQHGHTRLERKLIKKFLKFGMCLLILHPCYEPSNLFPKLGDNINRQSF